MGNCPQTAFIKYLTPLSTARRKSSFIGRHWAGPIGLTLSLLRFSQGSSLSIMELARIERGLQYSDYGCWLSD